MLRIHVADTMFNIIKTAIDQIQLADNVLRSQVQPTKLLIPHTDDIQPGNILAHLHEPMLDICLIQVKVIRSL